MKKKCLHCDKTHPSVLSVCPDDGSLLAIVKDTERVGNTLGDKYVILSELGRGGMGVVYKAQHKRMGRHVAIKVLLQSGQDQSAYSRFEQEARAISQLRNANIISVFDFDLTDDGMPYMVMDFIAGESMDRALAREISFSWQRAVQLALSIADALSHAHEKGVVHRDLKPHNVMLVRENGVEKPILMDFGLAKLFAQPGKTAQQLTDSGVVMGSVLYMSPEQCLGQAVDRRTDIYSFGCMLFEMVTGRAPFEGENQLQIIMKHINEHPPILDEYATNVPRELSDVVLKCMQKKPEDRYESADLLGTALQTLMEERHGMGSSAAGSRNAGSAKFSQTVLSGDLSHRDYQADSHESISSAESMSETADPVVLKYLSDATAGDTNAMNSLAWAYYFATGIDQDYNKAAFWFARAAKLGSAPAQDALARMYEEGKGVPRDYFKALELYQQAARQKHAISYQCLGYFYSQGLGCAPDFDKARYWYELAAEAGESGGYAGMGSCCAYGWGGPVDLRASVEWHFKAAESGSTLSYIEIVHLKEMGGATEAEVALAMKELERLGEAGDPFILPELYLRYRDGILGFPQDEAQAARWRGKCVEYGCVPD